MRRNILLLKLCLLCVCILPIVSCEEKFVPDIDWQEDVLVFDGLLTDEVATHSVLISKTESYANEFLPKPVSDFSVTIEDSNGRLIALSEKEAGRYVTSNDVKGELGHYYRLVAVSPDGKRYLSDYDQLTSGAKIDSIQAENEIRYVGKKSDANGYYEEEIDGLKLCSYINVNDLTPFYRYDYELLYQSIQNYVAYPFTIGFFVVQPDISSKRGFVGLMNGNLYENKHIQDKELLFVNKLSNASEVVIDSMEQDYIVKKMPTPIGFFFKLRNYSLSAGAFNFWQAIYDQSNVVGQLFDPVEINVTGNVFCENDKSEKVFGLFGASSVLETYYFIRPRSSGEIDIVGIDSYPNVTETVVSLDQFDFWRNDRTTYE